MKTYCAMDRVPRMLAVACALFWGLHGSAAADPVDDADDAVYRVRTVLPDAAKAESDAPPLAALTAHAPRTVHLVDGAADAKTWRSGVWNMLSMGTKTMRTINSSACRVGRTPTRRT